MSVETVRQESMGSPPMQLNDFQSKAKGLRKTNIDILSVDLTLKKRVREFRSLGSVALRCKVAAIFCALVLFIGWIPAYTLWKKARTCEIKKQALMNDVIGQIEKDTQRKFVISLNGEPFTTSKALSKVLDAHKLSDLQKYTILQLSHQGIYATLMNASIYDQINWGHRHAPIYQDDDKPLHINLRGDDTGTLREYYPKDITREQGKEIDIRISGWRKTPILFTRMRQGLSVYDATGKGPYQQRVIFEFDTRFTINARTGKMNIYPQLDQINPLIGPVSLYGSESDVEADDVASPTVSALASSERSLSSSVDDTSREEKNSSSE